MHEEADPAVIAYPTPFRLVMWDEDSWDPTIEDINDHTYDYVKLCRISASVDVGLGLPLCVHVGFGGCLLLPAIAKFHDRQAALQVFNRLLGEMLLGGIYHDALNPVDIGTGRLFTSGYFRAWGLRQSRAAQFYMDVATKSAGPNDTIMLRHAESISARDYLAAVKKGRAILDKVANLSPSLLLRGTSSFISNDWITALADLWICIEQVIASIWKNHVIRESVDINQVITGRRDFLDDYRTWTMSSKVELLFQKGVINLDLYALLNDARKARNSLIHNAQFPQKEQVGAAIDALYRLISLVLTDLQSDLELVSILSDYKELDPILKLHMRPKTLKTEEVEAWRYIPPIPGDRSWGNKEYEPVWPPDP